MPSTTQAFNGIPTTTPKNGSATAMSTALMVIRDFPEILLFRKR